ncbi:30S ribosome-binding factor RbfA [Caulobacter sp. NIBR1757]|uniref:30S ribosome-binding factor RbfA n=1 Tax=Caulobacter sp. NIBR1757 TaxID=3016000 RepID=UPI0022F05995|nr:30S ribosome-binding factor RbfA [Caulobacter sp. NIBR1757]WGM37354.1 Ribosome-binding factor A [Caulobacter sp. NIBR1757]
MSRHSHAKGRETGPSQRQLRAGELIRHALVEVLREEALAEPVLHEVSLTVSEVRMSPDLKHAICFVEPLGAGVTGQSTSEIVAALNRASKFLRGRLARTIDMKFTPDLKFFHDDSFNSAAAMDRLFTNPRVQADLHRDDEGEED